MTYETILRERERGRERDREKEDINKTKHTLTYKT